MRRNSLSLLRELIALPSVNSAYLPPGDPHAGEGRVVSFLADVARKAGLLPEFQQVQPGQRNLLVRLSPGRKPSSRVLLVPHLDTVGGRPFPGTLFSPRVRGDRVFGRGACDTKGSVAAMFGALLEVASAGRRPARTEILFAGLVDEEFGQTGSRALAQSGLRADLAIVGEPTSLKVVTAGKGAIWLEMQTRGKAAHGSRPELGRNAVHAMARIVVLLEEVYARELRRKRHWLLGHPTVNVGAMHGGNQCNVVPDRCTTLVDRRTMPGEKPKQVLAQLRGLLRRHGLSAKIHCIQAHPCPAMETSSDLPLVKELLRAVEQKRPAGVDFFSDAGVLAAHGTPSVIFGPGDIAQAHTAEEWVSIPQLTAAQAMLVRFLRSLP